MTGDLHDLAEARPELGLRLGTAPEGIDGWSSATLAFGPSGWDDIVGAYRRRMDGAPSYAAASCALQSHAGRVAGVVLWRWLTTQHRGRGVLWLPRRDRIWLRYESGSARAISVALDGADEEGTGDAGAAAEVLLGYLDELIALNLARHRVPRRTAYGNVAAACAGPFRRLAAESSGGARAATVALAERFFAADCWPYPGLIGFEESPPDPTLGYARGVCCLIYHAGSGHRCASCCLYSPEQRTRQWREHDPEPTASRGGCQSPSR